ncbi:MAG: hypothetical protein J6A03_00070 [Lachnospiraceae bacterium]|nr:hypothetical protein [Lachnospiraceae bacterium]
MLVTKKKIIIKKLLLVTAMMVGVFGLTGCTVKDVVVDKSQKDQTNVSYYDCDQNKAVDKWLVNINGSIRENGSMCIPGIFLVKDVPEFKNLTVNDLKIIMDAPVVYTNGTVDPSDPRVVTFTSPGNDVYAFTQEGLNAYNATGNETIQFDLKLEHGAINPDNPIRISSHFGIKKVFLNNEVVIDNGKSTYLYDVNGNKTNDNIDFWGYSYKEGENTIKVVDFLDKEKTISFKVNSDETSVDKREPKYEKGSFMGKKYIFIYTTKSKIKYVKINNKKIKFKKNHISNKKYFYGYNKVNKNIEISKMAKKRVKIEIKFKNGYLFKYKL